MRQVIFVVSLVVSAVLLSGCSGSGGGTTNCNGDTCGCALDEWSFDAKLSLSGVYLEHASRHYFVPNVANDVPNATESPCCNAVVAAIKGNDSDFCSSCLKSPNAAVATAANCSRIHDNTPVIGQRLHDVKITSSEALNPVWSKLQIRSLAADNNRQTSKPQEGRDCWVYTNGITLGGNFSNISLSTGTFNLRVRWTDPMQGPTPCCDALKPILKDLYVMDVPEEELNQDKKNTFCGACQGSINTDVALAAFRCWRGGAAGSTATSATIMTAAGELLM